jgi:hypothetical protein
MAMLNEELLDEKDKKIAQLEILIKRYKQYDKKRMEYVRNLEEKYNSLKSQFDENGNIVTQQKLFELQKGFSTLHKKLMVCRYPEYLDEYTEGELNAAYTFVNLKKQIKYLQDKIVKYRDTINTLICKFYQNSEVG